MREMSVAEQRYKAVLAVIADGRTVGEVASEWGVCRQTMHRRLARYEGDGPPRSSTCLQDRAADGQALPDKARPGLGVSRRYVAYLQSA